MTRRLALPALAFCCAVLGFALPARASVSIGMVANDKPDNCTPNTEYMQHTVGSGGPSYDAPTAGVITSWSTFPGPGTGTAARLKVYRATADPNTWTAVGESAVKALTPSTLNSAPTRIPVQAGDRIAIRTASSNGGPCDFPYGVDLGPGYSVLALVSSLDAPAGTNATFFDASLRELVNVAAVIEPDVDGDGFGDETQDACPMVAGPVQGCPAPPSPPVTPPAPPPSPTPSTGAKARLAQHLLRLHGIVVSVRPALASLVTATATVKLPGGSAVVRFRRAARQVAANTSATLTLKLSKTAFARVKKALARHRKLVANVVVTATAAGSNPATTRLKVHLTP